MRRLKSVRRQGRHLVYRYRRGPVGYWFLTKRPESNQSGALPRVHLLHHPSSKQTTTIRPESKIRVRAAYVNSDCEFVWRNFFCYRHDILLFSHLYGPSNYWPIKAVAVSLLVSVGWVRISFKRPFRNVGKYPTVLCILWRTMRLHSSASEDRTHYSILQ